MLFERIHFVIRELVVEKEGLVTLHFFYLNDAAEVFQPVLDCVCYILLADDEYAIAGVIVYLQQIRIVTDVIADIQPAQCFALEVAGELNFDADSFYLFGCKLNHLYLQSPRQYRAGTVSELSGKQFLDRRSDDGVYRHKDRGVDGAVHEIPLLDK